MTEQEFRYMAAAGGFDFAEFWQGLAYIFKYDSDLQKPISKLWNPRTNKADCFELLNAISKHGDITTYTYRDGAIRVNLAAGHSLGLGYFEGEAETLQDAICNLAVAIGRKMMEGSDE